MPIAYGQMKIENELAKNSESLLICDTNIFETMVYSKYYYGGTCDPLLKKYAMLNHYDLYLLTDIDIPWEKDDLRDKPNEREYSMKIFKDELEKNNLNYRLISGTKEKRLEIAIKNINDLI
jgi:nicotinamide riboside kinase